MKKVLADALRYKYLRDILPKLNLGGDGELDYGTFEGIEVIMRWDGNGYATQLDGIALDKAIDEDYLKHDWKETK